MIKKFAFALSVTTICGNIHPASAFQNNEASERDKSGITVKRMAVKRVVRTGRLTEERKKALVIKRAKRVARAERLAEHRKAIRMAKIARAERIAENRKIRKVKKIAQRNRIIERQNIRIARKKSARFESLLKRESFKEIVRSLINLEFKKTMTSQIKNELIAYVMNLRDLSPAQLVMKPIVVSTTRSQPFVPIQKEQTRTVVMDKPHQVINLIPVKVANFEGGKTLVDINSRPVPLKPTVLKKKRTHQDFVETNQPHASQKPTLLAKDRKDNRGVTAVLEKVVSGTIEHAKNTFNEIKKENYDHLSSYVAGQNNGSESLKDKQDQVKKLLKVSEKTKEDLENDQTLHGDALLNKKIETSKEEPTDLMADVEVVKSTTETENPAETPEKIQVTTPLDEDTPTPVPTPTPTDEDMTLNREGHTPLEDGAMVSGQETPRKSDMPTGKTPQDKDLWESWDGNHDEEAEKGIIPANVQTPEEDKLSLSVLNATKPVELTPALDKLISLGENMHRPNDGQWLKNVTDNISQLRAVMEGDNKPNPAGSLIKEMRLFRESIAIHPAEAQNERNLSTISAGVRYIKAWFARLLEFNGS